MLKIPMPKLLEVIGGTETNIYCRATVGLCRTCVLQCHWQSKWCICSLPAATLCSERLGGRCAWRFDWALLVNPTAQCTDLPGASGWNATRIAGGNPLVTQEKHVAQPRRGYGSLRTSGPRTSRRNLRRSLDWTGLACGLASQVTVPHAIGLVPVGLHENLDLLIASWFWRACYCPNIWGSGNHQATTWHIWAHTAILLRRCRCCIEVSGRTFEHLLKTGNKYNFFRMLQCFFSISNLSQTRFDGPWHCKNARPTYSCLTINLCFCPSYHLKTFWHGVFPHPICPVLDRPHGRHAWRGHTVDIL